MSIEVPNTAVDMNSWAVPACSCLIWLAHRLYHHPARGGGRRVSIILCSKQDDALSARSGQVVTGSKRLSFRPICISLMGVQKFLLVDVISSSLRLGNTMQNLLPFYRTPWIRCQSFLRWHPEAFLLRYGLLVRDKESLLYLWNSSRHPCTRQRVRVAKALTQYRQEQFSCRLDKSSLATFLIPARQLIATARRNSSHHFLDAPVRDEKDFPERDGAYAYLSKEDTPSASTHAPSVVERS